MTRQEALKFWEWRYENAKDYYDDHWEAEERRSHREYVEALEWAVKTLADRKTEPIDKDINVRSNSSEKPNNCEHITEDGVTCAKYPACDDCLDNPLNKVKGSKRLVKGSEQTEPTISKMEQVDKDINVPCKTEPQTYTCSFSDCENFKHFGFGEKCIECKRKQSKAMRKTEPQTEKPKIRKRNDKPFRAVWLDDDHNEIGTTQTERVETMSCQECKWWFTDSLKHGGYCQSLLYNHECRYEPEVDCSWK